MRLEDALLAAAQQPSDSPMAVLAAEVIRLQKVSQSLYSGWESVLVPVRGTDEKMRYQARTLNGDLSPAQPASCLGFNCSEWGNEAGHDYLELHWPNKQTLQLVLRPDGGELFGFIKIEQTAVNHWRLSRR